MAAVVFAAGVAVAAMLAPEFATDQPVGRIPAAIFIAVGSMPGLGLLGAALTSAALDDRTSATVAAVAIALAAPTAAVASAMIGVFVVVGFADGIGEAAGMAGLTLQAGVRAAIRIAPLLALLAVAWVAIMRRWVGPARA